MLAITVADVMTRGVETVGPDERAVDVARRLLDEEIGSLVVVDGGPTGIVTDTDLLGLVSEEEFSGTTAGDVMSSPLVTIGTDDTVVTAVDRMRENGISKLPVLEDDELVGIVTTRDVAHYVPRVARRVALSTEDRPEPRFTVRPETAYEREGWSFESYSTAEEGIAVGDRVEFTKQLTDEDVRSFAEASGDTNRLHLEEEYAEETRFGGRIVHGTLVGSLVSAALARLPGLTIYLSQELSFLGPVDIGAEVTAVCEVIEDLGRDRFVLTTDVYAGTGGDAGNADAEDEQVIEGEAVVLVDELPNVARPEREPLDDGE